MTTSLWSLLRGSSSQEIWDSAKFSLIKNIYITENEIGRGSFGVVYGAMYEGTQCVAKEIHNNIIGEGVSNNVVLQSFIKEINILSTLRHSNIVYFFGVHFRKGSHVPVLIVERMWMSLAKLLEERKSIPFVVKVHILHDVACGLKFLHSQDPPVIHRNLTANNILVNKNMDAKITDLGLATALEAVTMQQLSTAPGSLAYMSPEALQHNPMYTTKLDIFSFGCVSLHTLTQKYPMPTDKFELSQITKDTFIKVSEYQRRWKYVEMIKDRYTHFIYLISSCLKGEPEYRPDSDKVCKWIEEYWEKPEMKQNCSESLIDYFQQDKISLITSLEKQSKDMESTVKLYQAQFQELAASKDERISFLERQISDLQCQQLRLVSQIEKFQQDLSQHTDNEIIMNLNTMLRQEQEDMREKQKEIKELKMRLSNLEQVSTRIRREGERKEQELQEGNAQFQALQKKVADLNRNTEVINSQKSYIIQEKANLEQKVQDYFTSIQAKDEIREMNIKLHEEMEEIKLNLKHEEEMRIEMEKEAAYWKAKVGLLIEENATKEEIKQEVEDLFVIDDSSVNISSEILGSGSYSVIYAAQYHGKECAAKIAYSKSDKSFHKSLREECKLLVTLRHPCIIQLLGIFFTKDDPTSLVILMERMWLSLTEFLANKRYFQDKLTILHDVACGLCYIHSKNIIHCDLTGSNILLTNNINARLADFGQAVIYDPNSKKSLPANPGNIHHMPPEASATYSTKLDVFSFGCVVIHTVTQEFPLPNCDMYVETSNIGSYKKLSEVDRRSALIEKLKCDPNGGQLCKTVVECLQDHPDNRPTAAVLHLQFKNCLEKHQKIDTHEHSKVSFKDSTSASSTESYNKHLTDTTAVKSIDPAASVTSKKTEAECKLTLSTKLDMNVTDQGANMIAKVLLTTSSLKELNIANSRLKTTIAIKILTTLEFFSLKVLRLNNNDIDDEAADCIAAVISHNCLLEELNISCNNFSASGLIPIIQSLSMAKNIKLLDISSNFKHCSSTDEVEHLSTTLAECFTLQELNVSNNLLTFSNVLNIAEALRNHPSLENFNISNNITSNFFECEILMDIILSTNHLLTNINVCGRNIRSQFYDKHKDSNRFTLQNLCFSQNTSVNMHAQTANSADKSIGLSFKRAEEKYLIYREKMVSYCVDHNGDIFYDKNHDFAVIIPPGAVSQGHCVQVQVTANYFSHYKLPDGYQPISSYFKLSACYTFKIPVYLIMSHYAKIRNLEDIDSLCVLHACDHDMTSEEEMVMKKVPSGVYYDHEIGYCAFTTDHFCSFCLAKMNKAIPGKFLALLHTCSTNIKYSLEVCVCPALCHCEELTRNQYKEKKWRCEYSCPFDFAEEEVLLIDTKCFFKIKGWSVMQVGQPEISFDDFKHRKICDNAENLERLDKTHTYPPRFQFHCIKNPENMAVDLHLPFRVIKKNKNNDTSCIQSFSLVKNVTAIQQSNVQQLEATMVAPPEHRIFLSEPEMGDLNKIVVPKINAYWEDVAYALCFKIHTVEFITSKHYGDPKKCCKELLKNWLSTSNGVRPKNWSTLLSKLKDVEELVAAREEIMKELIKMYPEV